MRTFVLAMVAAMAATTASADDHLGAVSERGVRAVSLCETPLCMCSARAVGFHIARIRLHRILAVCDSPSCKK